MGKMKSGEERQQNLSARELQALFNGLEARYDLSNREMGVGKTYRSSDDVEKAWTEIAQEIASLGLRRTTAKIKAKGTDFKSTIKKAQTNPLP